MCIVDSCRESENEGMGLNPPCHPLKRGEYVCAFKKCGDLGVASHTPTKGGVC